MMEETESCQHVKILRRKLRPNLDISPYGIVVNQCAACGMIEAVYSEKLRFDECGWITAYNDDKVLNPVDCSKQ